MTGGLMQLVAYGAQDIYLTGDPMITHFKTVYRRHTNFAMECIEHTFNGTANFGTTVSAIISRCGDLIYGAFIETTLPDLAIDVDTTVGRWTENIGHFLIKQVEIEIGGQLIDRHYGEWLDIWAQLTVPANQKLGYNQLIGQGPPDALGRPTGLQKDYDVGMTPGQTIYIPLNFWFCRNIGLALPLIALQYHTVKINVTFAEAGDLVRTGAILTTNRLSNTKLWVDFIYLDVEERRKFSQSAHEYLIEQLQYNGGQLITANRSRLDTTTKQVDINFNHPIKELVWIVQPVSYLSGNNRQPSNDTSVISQMPVGQTNEQVDNYSSLSFIRLMNAVKQLNQNSRVPPGALNPVLYATLNINGYERVSQPGDYFNKIHPMKYHTNIPESPGINVYSFSVKPEDVQPSGSCNFSRIDKAYLTLTVATLQTADQAAEYPGAVDITVNPDATENITGTTITPVYTGSSCNVKIYALNYNVLRIMSGLGGVAFMN
jgi:hypothetical protein